MFEQIPANLYLLFFQQSLSTYDGSSKSREPLFSPFTFFFSTFEEEQRPDTAIVSHTDTTITVFCPDCVSTLEY